MKLFRTPAFFMNLLTETFADDNFRAFCIMIIVLTVQFANVFYIMNQERGGGFKGIDGSNIINDEIYSEDLDYGVINALIYSYKIALGDFSTTKFMGLNREVIWIFFVAATFLLQITFLNMLIAIMGNTFDHVLDNKQESSMKERISILADFRLLIRALKLDSEFSYLFVLQREHHDHLSNEW